MVGDSNDDINFANKLLLTDTQVSMICKASANSSSAHIKLSKRNCLRWYSSGEKVNDILAALMFSTISCKISYRKCNKMEGDSITVRKYEIKDIEKTIRSLQNRGILLKTTTRKINS